MKHLGQDARGFTLIEAIVAVGLIAAIAAGVLGLLASSVQTGRHARDLTVMTIAAVAKAEQVRSLDWSEDVAAGAAAPRTDGDSDLSTEPSATGGAGLGESPPDTLDRDTSGYVDYLDVLGRWVDGAAASRRAVYVRRWSVRHLPSYPDDSLAVQVLVQTVAAASSRRPGSRAAHTGQDVLLETIVTRRAR